MNNLINKKSTPIGALFVAALFLMTMAILAMSNITHADNNKTPQNGRLLTIHDRGVEKAILSQAATVGDALTEAGISVDSKDAVEPSLDQKLVASDYQINIYRARPVIIVDGNIRTKIITPYQTAAQIAESAGIKLYDEDVTSLDRTDNILADGAGLQLTISRATPFTFTLYGKTSTIRTRGATIADMLAEKSITLASDDRVSLPLDTKITSDLTVRIWREGKQTITVDEAVNFEIEKVEDADLPVSYIAIKTPGIAGIKSVTYEVIIQDGKEVSRAEIASIVTQQPVKQVEIVGAKGQYTTPSENENITWDYLTHQGFNRFQTAAIMGNLMQEHRFETSDVSGGFGIAQWTGGRRVAIMSLPNANNIYVQLDFLMGELNGGYASSVRDAIKSSNSLESATAIFQNNFERCNPNYCMLNQRVSYARDVLASH